MRAAQSENIAEGICAWAESQPDKPAILGELGTRTYAELAAEIDTWAARFAAAGLRAGDTALVFLPQSAAAIAAYFGLMRCGAVPSFMPLPSAKQEPGYYWSSHCSLLKLIAPAALVTTSRQISPMRDAGFAETVEKIFAIDDNVDVARWRGASPGRADEVALLQHSSGTTALKKGVQLSHRAISLQIEAYAVALRAEREDVVVSWLPTYHDMGLIACTVMPMLLGQTLVLLDPFRWVSEPRLLLDAITTHRGTLTWLPNFAFELLAKTVRYEPGSLDLSSMRAFVNCSEPCKPQSFDRFLATFTAAGVKPEALQVCYAMAETVFAVSQTEPGRPVGRLTVDSGELASNRMVAAPRDAGSALELLCAGRPLEGVAVTIVDAEGKALPSDHVGEIELAAPFLFSGYLNRPEISAAKLRSSRYRTSDFGFLRNGELYVLGRADDLIIVHGRNYFAHEIEAVVNDVPGLKAGRNVAVGVFNEMLGSQEVVVIAESDPSSRHAVDPLALKRAVKHLVAQHMALDLRDARIVAPGWLVKTSSGKISRALNRDKHMQEMAAARGRK